MQTVRSRHRGKQGEDAIVALDRFIRATRDSGYKGTGSAISELVDNAIQAGATCLSISIGPDPVASDESLCVEVIDNGCGMDSVTLQQALRFGGSSRFNDRTGLGRYGMGLPNSSLSQARRVEVFTWQSPNLAVRSFLDVDEVAAGAVTRVPPPSRAELPRVATELKFGSGTVVRWTKCDRLDYRRTATIASKLRPFLGRVFRYFLWDGVAIQVNGEPVQAIDPLFVHERSLVRGGRQFGEPLEYQIEAPLPDGRGVAAGQITVRFSELPVEEWHEFSNERKRELGVLNGAGVSVVRARREIDHGWFLFGQKRKENYDDWWRCEVQFDPGLDEVFGITHTKQQIRPTHGLMEAIVPDLEATAKALNRRVRRAHEQFKVAVRVADSEKIAGAREQFLPPLRSSRVSPALQRAFQKLERQHPRIAPTQSGAGASGGLRYSIVVGNSDGTRFFRSYHRDGQLVLALNTEHPFYRRIYAPLSEREDSCGKDLRRHLDLVLLAAARSEVTSGSQAGEFLDAWSDVIATFLQS